MDKKYPPINKKSPFIGNWASLQNLIAKNTKCFYDVLKLSINI
jgi:hypothetical protein